MNYFWCVSWKGNFQDFLDKFSFLDSGQGFGYCHLILNSSGPETNDVCFGYKNDLGENLEKMTKTTKKNDGCIDIVEIGIPKNFLEKLNSKISFGYSKFGKITVGADGSFFDPDIKKIKNGIFREGKLLFSETISELILNLLVKRKTLLDGIKSVPDYLGGEYNFAVLEKGIYLYCGTELITATRRDGGVLVGTNFKSIPDYNNIVKKTFLHLQKGSFQAVL